MCSSLRATATFRVSTLVAPCQWEIRSISCETPLALRCATGARYAVRDNSTLDDRNHRLKVVMSSDESSLTSPVAPIGCPRSVLLSRWVNERFPDWEELLTAHEVARLRRRPRWLLPSLMLLGRFPRKHRFQGRGVGWLRSDVLTWLAKGGRTPHCHSSPLVIAGARKSRQQLLPLGYRKPIHTAQRRSGTCMHFRNARIPRKHESCRPMLELAMQRPVGPRFFRLQGATRYL